MKKLTIDETIERYEKYLSLDITTVEPWIARSMMGTLNDLRTEIEKKYPELLGDSATHDEIDYDFRYLSLYCRNQNLNFIEEAKKYFESGKYNIYVFIDVATKKLNEQEISGR